MKYAKEFKIGVFVVIVSVASFFLINYLRGEDIFNREFEVSAKYESLEGLVASAPVYIKGFKAGKVSEVNYCSETGDFEVVCSISKVFSVPEDSRMTIYGVDIMGSKGVRIDLGSSSMPVEDGGSLCGGVEAGLVDGLASEIGPLLSKVATTLDSLGVTVSGVNRVLTEKNTESISRTISHLERTMADVRNIAASVEGKSAELETFIANLSTLSDSFNVIASKVDTTVASVNELMTTVNDADVEKVISSMNTLLENINDPDGSVSKLLTEDSIYNSVDELLNDVDTLIKKIQENPKKYIKISVF
ncbi:MAG: MCE family protein [Bacteroidales bacterium]|nr:MCE family protein [Bacteroidales bacterium]